MQNHKTVVSPRTFRRGRAPSDGPTPPPQAPTLATVSVLGTRYRLVPLEAGAQVVEWVTGVTDPLRARMAVHPETDASQQLYVLLRQAIEAAQSMGHLRWLGGLDAEREDQRNPAASLLARFIKANPELITSLISADGPLRAPSPPADPHQKGKEKQ